MTRHLCDFPNVKVVEYFTMNRSKSSVVLDFQVNFYSIQLQIRSISTSESHFDIQTLMNFDLFYILLHFDWLQRKEIAGTFRYF